MFAIVDIAGKQFRVEKDKIIKVPYLHTKVGDSVEFDRVLILENDGKTQVGHPVVEGAKISAKVLEHGRDKKVIVFKKKRRKGYKVKNGHRQFFSKIQIENIA
ncbi:MAG TPA: 50S ribosomal protein L21 [Caldithrix sp.]|nr:50S ribosomal protein L21 [Caldithrix sp.]